MTDKPKMTRFDEERAALIFDKLNQDYRIIAPVEKIGEGRFSDANLLTYDEVTSFSQIDFSRQTFFSAKAAVFPLRETMFTFESNEGQRAGPIKCLPKQAEKENTLPIIVFLRSCDIHAIHVTDAQFLKNNDQEDPFYKKRRENVKIFLIECTESFENCYCVSMGTNKTEDWSAFMRKTNNGYEVQVKDKELEKYFPLKDGQVKNPQFVKKNMRQVEVPEEIDVSIFTDDIWKEYTARCIACGRCNTSCPTCTCFTVGDIFSKEKNAFERRRIWSACHVKKFGLLAGNHDFRVQEGDRMRYKTLHKISDFKKRHGFQMCTGCGRCDDVCPEYISMFKCIDKINTVIKKKENDG